ncbi:MAG: AmmeMemoRadiSam system protein B [Patescibacteria group bacterium]|jgi:poly-gamma-glutamate synthesis protein (capsule biosynthesis protein)
MKLHWSVLIVIIAGLICGICAAILFLPERVETSSSPPRKAEISASSNSTPPVVKRVANEGQGQNLDIPGTVSKDILDAAFSAKMDWTVKAGTRVILVPHHLVAAREIASLVSAVPKPSTVYLVVPDHFGACKTPFCESPIEGEHAVTGLVPFLQRAWGTDVKIVPIMVRPDATEEKMSVLTSTIIATLQKDKDALLVDSIDASHYQPAEVADFHDELTQDVISSLADKEVRRAEIDAPAVLRVALRVARDLGLGDVTIHTHTNSLRILQAQISQDSTSHFLVSFAPGEIKPQQDVTLLFLGDMMFDRNVATRSKTAGSLDYPFKKILGQENRFFRGQDLIVGNLEGPVTDKRLPPNKGNVDFMFDPKILVTFKKVGISAVSQANNHTYDQGGAAAESSRQKISQVGISVFGDQVKDDEAHALTIVESRGRKIALLGFNTTDNPLDKELAAQDIKSARQKADYTIVFMHWGNEYQAKPNKTQTDLAHWLVEQGVDAVMGGHPHWMQSVEIYHGKPIAYSLGNFIFDQDWSTETKLGLVVGLDLSKQGSGLYLYPVRIDKSQPILLTGKERQTRLDYLASVSDKSLSSQIKQGVIKTINN